MQGVLLARSGSSFVVGIHWDTPPAAPGSSGQEKETSCGAAGPCRDLPAAYELLLDQGPARSAAAAPSSGDSSSDGGGGERGAGEQRRQQEAEGSGANPGDPSNWVAEYAGKRYSQLGGLEYSSGVISFNWSLSRRFEALRHHNVFLSGALGFPRGSCDQRGEGLLSSLQVQSGLALLRGGLLRL